MGKKTSAAPPKLGALPKPVDNLPTSAAEMFAFLIHPITIDDFLQNYWEKKPLHISRDKADYFGSLFTREQLLHKLNDEGLILGTEIKAMRYNKAEDRREDVSADSEEDGEPIEVTLKEATKMWSEGYTFQVIQPQHYTTLLWRLLAGLEASFGSLWGANCYLTPGGTQGLAPHWDDVEVFVMQIEGEKEWTLFENVEDGELDPECSGDLPFDEFKDDSEALLKVTLKAGDLLYFPRGTIHFANCPKGEKKDAFSNHITISTYQNQSYGSLISTMVSNALDKAMATDVAFRAGLPIGYGKLFGEMYKTQSLASGNGTVQETRLSLAHDAFLAEADEVHPMDRTRAMQPCGNFGKTVCYDNSQQARAERSKEMRKAVASLLHKLGDMLDIDAAVDELQEDFQKGRLPPHNAVMEARDIKYQDIVKRQNELGEKMAEFEMKARQMGKGKKGQEIQMPPAIMKQVEQIENEMDQLNNEIVAFGPSPRDSKVAEVRLANPDAIRVILKNDDCSGDKMLLLYNAFKNDRRLHMAASYDDEDGHDDEDFADEEEDVPMKGGKCTDAKCTDADCKDGEEHGSDCDSHDHSEAEEEEDACGHVPEGVTKLSFKKPYQLLSIRLMADLGEQFTKVSELPFPKEEEARRFLEQLWLAGVVESKHFA